MTDSFAFTAGLPAGDHGDTYDVDLVDEDTAPVEPASALAQIKADVADDGPEPSTFPIPGRPGYTATFRADLQWHELDTWQKRAKGKRGVDNAKYGALLLANACLELHKGGRRLVDEAGDPLNFRHPELLAILEVRSASDAVRRFYGRDGDVDAAARAVMAESGWGDDLQPLDPTAAG